MTKAELIGRVASKKDLPRGLTKKTVARIVDVVFTEIGDYFIRARPTRPRHPGFPIRASAPLPSAVGMRVPCATLGTATRLNFRHSPPWSFRPVGS